VLGTFLQVVRNSRMVREEIHCGFDEKVIGGYIYIPEGTGPFPLVVISHGLGGSHLGTAPYARRLAEHGYAACVFDFCGGTAGNGKSSGKSTEMSVLTEMEDLLCVLSESEHWSFVDQSQIFLMGESQGGIVSLLTAAKNPAAFAGLIFLYTAFSLVKEAHRQFGSKEYVPREFSVFHGWIRLGKKYVTDIWDLDIETAMEAYSSPVLLLHGDKDDIIPVSDSKWADRIFTNSNYYEIHGAGHGFGGEYFEEAVSKIISFLER